MKNQKCKSKARELNKRLVTGAESFQLVNPRNFGTAHTRNERQHEQRMKSLHSQQSRRLARLEDEMDEVRAHQRMLKEVDETTRDPRTAVQKTTALDYAVAGANRDEIGKQIKHDCATSTGVSRAREASKHSTTIKGKGFTGQNASVLNISGLTIGEERPKSANSRIAYNRMMPRDAESNGCASRIPGQKSGNNGLPSRTCAMGSNGSFLSGLLDIRVKRDATLSRRYNYNLTKADDLALPPKEKRRPNTPKRQASVEPQFISRHPRENNSLNRSRSGKQSTTSPHDASGQSEGRQHAELMTKPDEDASIHGRRIRAMTSRDLTGDATLKKVAGRHGHGKRSVRFQHHGPDKYGTEIGQSSSSSGDEGLEETPTEPSEKNWGRTLRKCRYLRKPKGYETPEIPIEAVFQRDVTIT